MDLLRDRSGRKHRLFTKRQGKSPSVFTWAGEDKTRGYLAVDTVYIPQLAITDKDGYRHTYPGKPAQFAVLLFKEKGRTVVELSTKRLFADKKADLTKEAPVFLDKVGDLIREESKFPFGLQAYDVDTDLARAREAAVQKYFSDKLLIPDTQISLLDPADPEKRGLAIAVILTAPLEVRSDYQTALALTSDFNVGDDLLRPPHRCG